MTRQFIASAVLATLSLTACGVSVSQSDSTDTEAESVETEASVADVATTEAEMEDTAAATTEAMMEDTAAATTEVAMEDTAPAATEAAAASGPINIDTDGPTACIDAAIAQLGPDAMINEITSYFETGDDIDPPLIEDDEPPVPGNLTTCKAFYQDPSDPIKLLAIQMDTETGEFSEPGPVEINFSGDASEFDLNDYVMKASDVNTSIVKPKMDEKAPELDAVYSLWRWNGVSLVAPGPFNDVHAFDLRMEGRLAKNDLSESGYITFTMDGTVINDFLVQ